MRHVLTGAAMLLVVGTTAACGSGAPDDASTEDFCEAFSGITKVENGKDLNDLGDELEEVGTPDDISDEEREGFEVFVDAAKDVDEDAKPDDFDDQTDVSKDDEKKGDKFIEYASEKCADEMTPPTDDLPTDPGDIETDDLPTDGTTDVPIDPDDLPTDPEELESYLEEQASELESQ